MTGSYTSTIPRCIPDGEYLLRIQSLAIHNPGGVPQVSRAIVLCMHHACMVRNC